MVKVADEDGSGKIDWHEFQMLIECVAMQQNITLKFRVQ
jgi:hypothetical protein